MNELFYQILEYLVEFGWKFGFEVFLVEYLDLDMIEVVFFDINGVLWGKWLFGVLLKKVFEQGVVFFYLLFGFDVWGWEVEVIGMYLEIGDKDGVCWFIFEMLKFVFWMECKIVQVFLFMYDCDGVLFLVDLWYVLENVVVSMKEEFGVMVICVFELEFYLFEESGGDWIEQLKFLFLIYFGFVCQNMYVFFDLEVFFLVVDDLCKVCEVQGILVDVVVFEVVFGQFEFNLYYRCDLLFVVDDVVLLCCFVVGVVCKYEFKVFFMVKLFVEWLGNGMYVYVFMEDNNGNLFVCLEMGNQKFGYVINGLMKMMLEVLLLFIFMFNGFWRMQFGFYVFVFICWGFDNWFVVLWVLVFLFDVVCVEYWIVGVDVNFYLVLIGILVGMMEGLRFQKDLLLFVIGNVYEKCKKCLMFWMDEVIDVFEVFKLMKQVVGVDMYKVLIEIKCEELNEFGWEILFLEWQIYL